MFCGLKLFSLNCNSIIIQHVHKSGLLKTLIDSENLHIVLGCESKLDSSITSGEVFPSNYEIFRSDRISGNAGGGVFIAAHDNILVTHESKLHSDMEAIWVKIEFVKQKPLYLATVHRQFQDHFISSTLNIDPSDKQKKFWSYIKAKRQDQIGVPPLRTYSGIKVDFLSNTLVLDSIKCSHRKMYHRPQ